MGVIGPLALNFFQCEVMKTNKIFFGLVCCLCVSVFGVSSFAAPKPKKLADCPALVKKAIQKIDKKDFYQAEEILLDVRMQCAGHSVIDTAEFYLGKAFVGQKKFEEAKLEFRQVVSDYPTSAFAREALYMIGYCSFAAANEWDRDQAGTKDALKELTTFLEEVPDGAFADSARALMVRVNDRLAKKEFMSAVFYQTAEEYESAVIYLRAFITDYATSTFVPEAQFRLAQCFVKLQQQSDARQILDSLCGSATDNSELCKKVTAFKKKLDTAK